MPGTYELIKSTSTTSSATSVDFTNISSAYTDLVIVVSASVNSSATDLFMRFNSDTGTNYSSIILYGTGSTKASTAQANANKIICDWYGFLPSTSTEVTTIVINIADYSNSTTRKSALIRANYPASGAGVDFITGTWRNSNGIDTITLLPAGNSFKDGSTFYLYGIKAV